MDILNDPLVMFAGIILIFSGLFLYFGRIILMMRPSKSEKIVEQVYGLLFVLTFSFSIVIYFILKANTSMMELRFDYFLLLVICSIPVSVFTLTATTNRNRGITLWGYSDSTYEPLLKIGTLSLIVITSSIALVALFYYVDRVIYIALNPEIFELELTSYHVTTYAAISFVYVVLILTYNAITFGYFMAKYPNVNVYFRYGENEIRHMSGILIKENGFFRIIRTANDREHKINKNDIVIIEQLSDQ